jgi:hypothetical protein
MRKFILKIVVFIIIFLICDRIVGSVISISAVKNAKDKRIGRVLSKDLQAELLILGASGAARNYVGSEITRTSGLTVYSLGFPGSNIDFHAELLKIILEAGNCPRIIMLEVNNVELKDNKTVNFRYDVLSPYIADERIQRIFEARERLSPELSRMFATYKQKNNLWTAIAFGRSIDVLDRIENDGSMPIDNKSITYSSMIYGKSTENYSIQNESPLLIERFKEFVSICDKKNIKLIIVLSPNYKEPVSGLIPRLKQLTGEKVVFLDYSKVLREKENYYDYAHLDKNGAMKLSALVGYDVKNFITDLHYVPTSYP